MNPLLSKVIIVAVAAALIVPAAYYIMLQQSSSATGNNPFNYVPSDSQLVLEGHLNSSTLYLFDDNNSIGFILPFTISELQLLSNATSMNSSTHIVINHYSSYLSKNIYAVDNFSISSMSLGFSGLNSSLISVAAGLVSGVNGTFYATDAGGAGMVLGNLSAVEHSISSAEAGRTFASSSSIYLDGASNYTFYYRPGNISSINYVTGNISDGHSNFYLSLSNSTSLGSSYFVRNGTYNVSVSVRPGAIMIGVTGNYTLSQLEASVSGYLRKAGI